MQARTVQNESVDALCWRVLGRTGGVVEATLQANPGLAARGPLLPAGVLVELPETPAAPERPTVKLWD
ncbi:tail protein X [uncultured Xylophilus sp.]|uniref:tail protein X n=1 Tax=uncultured Xylophilus sp. TaxID=296832 RepID=UPI0025E9EE6A|nr:tail protein X [uncultured Xylophilus sp.]